jgi:hypothetical protein
VANGYQQRVICSDSETAIDVSLELLQMTLSIVVRGNQIHGPGTNSQFLIALFCSDFVFLIQILLQV